MAELWLIKKKGGLNLCEECYVSWLIDIFVELYDLKKVERMTKKMREDEDMMRRWFYEMIQPGCQAGGTNSFNVAQIERGKD